MSTVLVVLRERESAEGISAALRAAGYAVHQCCGPEAFHCPVLEGEHCDFVDEADALVYGLGLQPIGPETDDVLFGMLRWISPTAPLIIVDDQLTGSGESGTLESGSIKVEQLAIRDRLVQMLQAPLVPEQVVSCVADALALRSLTDAA